MTEIFLKLRNNIVLESDLQLAEREIQSLFAQCRPINNDTINLIKFIPKRFIVSHSKKDGVIGYIVSGCKVKFEKIIKLLSFVQEVWSSTELCDSDVCYSVHNCGAYCYIPTMTMSEILFYTKNPGVETAEKVVKTLALVEDGNKEVDTAINRVKTSAPHIHSFHTYKAKFFPRFVRSLIVSNIDNERDEIKICDPFVGSGTTLIESALMGYKSIGIDIDALSCFISQVKSSAIDLVQCKCANIDDVLLSTKGTNHYTFPEEIVKKFQRWDKLEEMYDYQNQISSILNYIDSIPSPQKELLKIALSDALTRKFNIRMMGTGSGRFALEIGKTSLVSIIKSDIANEIKAIRVICTLRDIYNLVMPSPVVINGDATKRPIESNSVDLIITSPPYIPASSGREDYLVGKLISLKAMGLYNNNDVDYCKKNSVGSMNIGSDELGDMPQDVVRLYKWLINDELRCIKARPIIAYYKSIISSLKEDVRTLKNGGRIIYIIGKETIFYNSATKEILYNVECDKIFSEIARMVGLSIVEIINIELDKKDKIARPRGSDKYYECAIVMEKPNSKS